MSSAPKGYGWADCGGGERTIEPCYVPDMAAEIDGDDTEQTDFSIAGELLHELLAFAFAYRGGKPQPNLHVAFRRFVCIVWLTRPEFLGDKPLMDLGPELGCTRANLSKLIRDFGDSLGGLRNRLQKTESARAIYSTAQLKDHWRNRAKKRPAAPCETAGCHGHNEIPNAEDSA